jgi:hypothetical protein
LAQVADTVTPPATDTTIRVDTAVPVSDSPAAIVATDSVSKRPLISDTSWQVLTTEAFAPQILRRHPYFHFNARPVSFSSNVKKFAGKEVLFYVLVALVLLFALFKLFFAKYLTDLFRVFFQTTMKQRQIRDQLMQTPLPSLLFNFFFIACTGLYINLVLQHYQVRLVNHFWLQYLYCAVGLAVIYTGKFIGLKICGWLFNMEPATESYLFIVFIINKVIGIFLLPFVVMLGFSSGIMVDAALMLSWCGIALLLLYRFILGFTMVRNEVRFNLFHFFLYLCAFEIAPLLLIYRLLLLFF